MVKDSIDLFLNKYMAVHFLRYGQAHEGKNRGSKVTQFSVGKLASVFVIHKDAWNQVCRVRRVGCAIRVDHNVSVAVISDYNHCIAIAKCRSEERRVGKECRDRG